MVTGILVRIGYGCDSTIDSRTVALMVKLHNAPIDYEEVNISFARVKVITRTIRGKIELLPVNRLRPITFWNL